MFETVFNTIFDFVFTNDTKITRKFKWIFWPFEVVFWQKINDRKLVDMKNIPLKDVEDWKEFFFFIYINSIRIVLSIIKKTEENLYFLKNLFSFFRGNSTKMPLFYSQNLVNRMKFVRKKNYYDSMHGGAWWCMVEIIQEPTHHRTVALCNEIHLFNFIWGWRWIERNKEE